MFIRLSFIAVCLLILLILFHFDDSVNFDCSLGYHKGFIETYMNGNFIWCKKEKINL